MRISELEASLFYRVSYRTARATQKTLSQKKKKFHSINIMCHFLIHDKIKTDNNFINSTQVYLQNS